MKLRLSVLLLLTCSCATTSGSDPEAPPPPQRADSLAPAAVPEPALVQADDDASAPLPYTPEAIRDYCVPGTVLKFILRQGPMDPTFMAFHFTGGDAEWAELEEVHRDANGEEVNRSTQRTSWKDLQSHASFPREQTELSEESCETRSGTWNCWRYDVKKEGSTERYWFAKDKPGPPVKLEVLAGGAVVFTMELIELQHPS